MLSRRATSAVSAAVASARRLAVVSSHLLDSSSSQHFSSSSSPETRHQHGAHHGALLFAAGAASSATAAAAFSTLSESTVSHCEEAKPPALNPKEFIPFTLKQVEVLNHNTKVFRFELQPGQKLGMSVASCLLTKAPLGPPGDDGKPKPVIRPYTPVSQPNTEGFFDLLIKVYPNGKMSSYIDTLKPGDTLEVKGPIPKLPYTANMKKRIGMVAGGSGITPMLQVVDAILNDPSDNTQVSLVFANTSPADVLLKERLEDYAAHHPNFKVFFIVDKAAPSSGWKGGVGFVTPDLLVKAMPPPGDDSLVLVCGPPGMMKHISGDKAPDKSQGELSGLLKELGYTKEQVYKF